MGLFYSTLSYLKSFYSTPPPVIPLNEIKINVSANKLIHTLRHKQIKIQKQAKNVQHNLLVVVNGMKNTRSIAGQQQLMQVIVRKSQQVAAYQQIIRCANVIKNQAKILEIDSKKISQNCLLAICTIIYAYKQLQLNQCINLNDFVPQPHPIISKKQISEALREYVDFKQASFFAINTYVLQMCKRNQISLEKINQVGHNFSYNPSKIIQRQSKSNQMFALSLQQLGIQQDFAICYDKKLQQQIPEQNIYKN